MGNWGLCILGDLARPDLPGGVHVRKLNMDPVSAATEHGDMGLIVIVAVVAVALVAALARVVVALIRKRVEVIEHNQAKFVESFASVDKSLRFVERRLDNHDGELEKVSKSLERGAESFRNNQGEHDRLASKIDAIAGQPFMTREDCQVQHTEHLQEHIKINTEMEALRESQGQVREQLATMHGAQTEGFGQINRMLAKLVDGEYRKGAT